METCPYCIAAAINSNLLDEIELVRIAIDALQHSEEYSDLEETFFERNLSKDQDTCDEVLSICDLLMCTGSECGRYKLCNNIKR